METTKKQKNHRKTEKTRLPKKYQLHEICIIDGKEIYRIWKVDNNKKELFIEFEI